MAQVVSQPTGSRLQELQFLSLDVMEARPQRESGSPRTVSPLHQRSRSCSQIEGLTEEEMRQLQSEIDTLLWGTRLRLPIHGETTSDITEGQLYDFVNIFSKGWLEDGEDLTPMETTQATDVILGIFELRNHPTRFYIPVLVYTDRYIKKRGKVERRYLVPLLFMASILAIKFWSDSGINLRQTSIVCGVDRLALMDFEWKFLSALEYSLFVSEDEALLYRSTGESHTSIQRTTVRHTDNVNPADLLKMKSIYKLALLFLFAAAAFGLRDIRPVTLDAAPLAGKLLNHVAKLEKEPANPFSSGLIGLIRDLVSGNLKSAAHVDAADVQSALSLQQQRALVLVINGQWLTEDHKGQQFISVDEKSKAVRIKPFLPYMNTMASILEKFSPQKFIPFTVSSFANSNNPNAADTYAVFDLHNGYVYIRDDAVGTLDNVSDEDLHKSYQKFSRHVETKAAEHDGSTFSSPIDMFRTFSMPLAEILVNPWVLCLSCMVVLVFIAPLAANYILINLALYVCTALSLTDTTCSALWASAAALVFISLPFMAYGIYTVCGLWQCQHPVTTATKALF
ncbi:hypothetical protein PROFUN_14213 [Planoprotostelium fungivorum]|uniref:Uncharacterized protein n=1 Tax=Planoprotostelium fungivorum TaxID=1890364 RepID=A0A2P6N0M5_9EUKA|nr:hypothetical protein PROFUN_14213 [Planoprotostelium fungivorum]